MKQKFLVQLVFAIFIFFAAFSLLRRLASRNTTFVINQDADNTTKMVAQSDSKLEPSVTEIARQVTVRLLIKQTAGSGVIVARQEQTYTVLTCEHVVNSNPDTRFTILTPDGQTYQGYRKRITSLKGVDLAVVQFQSQISYRIAVLRNSQSISIGELVYASGFPNYYYRGLIPRGETLDWGLKAYRLTVGKVFTLLSKKFLPYGYQLGYTNDIEVGMSGGPVLDRQGRLIGINGRTKNIMGDLNDYSFTDGTLPSPELFKRMEALSWAIPVSVYQQRTGQ